MNPTTPICPTCNTQTHPQEGIPIYETNPFGKRILYIEFFCAQPTCLGFFKELPEVREPFPTPDDTERTITGVSFE